MPFGGEKISAVIPCHNEADGLRTLLPELGEWVDEVIVVDNRSVDATAEVAMACGARVVREDQIGYGRAYRRGLPVAAGSVLVTLDGDGSYPPAECRRLVGALIEQNLDFVSGCRFPLRNPKAMRPRNRMANGFISWLARTLYRIDLVDSQSGLWVFRRGILDRVLPRHPGMSFSQEIKLNALLDPRIRFAELPIEYLPRVGQVKFRACRDAVSNLMGLLGHYHARPY